jgi:hypothetical protein
MRRGTDSSYGYAFANALSDAICALVEARSLSYKGLDLGPAIQRALYIDLVNRVSLYDAFVSGGGSVAVANQLEAEVAGLVAPGCAVVTLERPRWLESAARVRRRIRRRSPIRGRRCDVLATALHPKFHRFLAPVVHRLNAEVLTELKGRPPLRALGDLGAYPEILGAADAAEQAIVKCRPRAVVAVEGNAPADAVLAAVARRAGITSLVLQQGWSPHVHAGFRAMPFDKMLVWGLGFAETLASFNPGVSFEVVGNHAIEPRRNDEELDSVGVFLQSTSQLIAPEHLEQLVELAAELAEEAPRVFVREHPSSPLPDRLRVRVGRAQFANAPGTTLATLLGRCSSTLSIYSTTLFESVATGAVPVSFNPTSLPRLDPSLAGHLVGFEEREAAAAKAAVLDGRVDPGDRERFLARYFAHLGEDATTLTAAAISEVAETRP